MIASVVVTVFHANTAYPIDTVAPTILDTPGHLRFKQNDNSLIDVADPILVPPQAPTKNYSWRKYVKLQFRTAPPHSITNLRWFADPANPLITGTPNMHGVRVLAGANLLYIQPTVVDNTNDLTSSLAGGSDASTRTSLVPMQLVGTGSVTSTADPVLTAPSTGYGNQPYLVTQMEVPSTALAGPTADLVLIFRYDEL